MGHIPQDARTASPPAERHRARLLRYARLHASGDFHRAEDIVQETMLRAWLTLDDVDCQGDQRLQAWLYRVARNLAIDAHRRDRTVPVGLVPEEPAHQGGEAELADTVATRQVLYEALSRLSREHREVLVHIHLRDRSRAETARATGVPQGTVKSRNHYALEALRRSLPAA
ncbi:sigma-70 family RNA polymerase sigma factor [Streptomyces sp. NRRL F-5630]|uniref:sigma-70 family RNA polymerase sigma factor n=1 Tax=unclassified Streptomyces TaxID=2593676 RepID=UPI0004CA27C6|nr:sigma-70 family RNA polymerase sigma factor [Streptomyces sp. NRRL F-5630]